MKKIIFIITVFLVAVTSVTADPLEPRDYSLAMTDDIRAVYINPAAMAYGNGQGLGLMQDPGNIFAGTADYSDNVYLFAASPYLGVILGKEDESLFKSAALSFGPVYNIYAGAGFSWNDKDYQSGTYTAGILARPIDALSIGTVYRSTVGGDWSLGAGTGVRPLWFSDDLADLLEAGIDMYFGTTGVTPPVVHVKAQPVKGIALNGLYDFKDGSMRAGVSVSFDSMLAAFGADILSSGTSEAQDYFLHFNPLEYTSVLNKKAPVFYDYSPGTILAENPGILPPEFAAISGSGRTVWEIINEIKALADDDRVYGLVFRNQLIAATRTNYHELEKALLEFKDKGKPVVFYFEIVDTANYALAAAVADKIYLNPSGSVYISGTGSTRLYLNDFLAKNGIRTVDFQSHEYKTANNTYTKSTMTDAEREALTDVYQGIQADMERRIASGRGNRLAAAVKETFNHGPYFLAADALASGLVDGLLYEDELDETIAGNYNGTQVRTNAFRAKVRSDWADSYQSQIAVIYATGAIYTGQAAPGQAIGSDTVVQALRDARNNPLTRAIVLRVDSPGGSAIASDIIAREVSVCREAPYNLPVVVSMGSVAGSGGYYISCTSDYIIAQPDTITGSIGVAGFSFDIEGLLEKFNINTVSLYTRDNSDIGNITREMSEEENTILTNYIQGTYDIFVNAVAKGRGMSYDEVHKIARGRIWTGTKALQLGLIDGTGSFTDAVDKAAELAGINNEPELVTYNGYNPGIKDLGSLYLSTLAKQNLPESIVSIVEDMQTLQRFGSFQALTIMPLSF